MHGRASANHASVLHLDELMAVQHGFAGTDFCGTAGKLGGICGGEAVLISQGKAHALLADGLFHEGRERC